MADYGKGDVCVFAQVLDTLYLIMGLLSNMQWRGCLNYDHIFEFAETFYIKGVLCSRGGQKETGGLSKNAEMQMSE